MGVLSNSTKRN